MWELQLCGQVLDKAEKSSAAQLFQHGEDSMDSTYQAAKVWTSQEADHWLQLLAAAQS